MKNKQTILLVDDVKENIDILIELLSDYDLIPALDGQTAIDIINSDEDIDLILLDIMMPELDGFEVCKLLKNDTKTVHIPIIFLSAKNRDEDITRGFKLGGVDYVTKPFNPNELLSRVSTHLKLRAYEKDLERRVQKEIKINKLQEQMIYQQSKQAGLGELLMHIAHQWKQPLATLGSINLLAKANIERCDEDSKEILAKSMDQSINKSEELIMFMSNTIDTFGHFYQPSYKNKDFLLSESVLDILSIIEATFYFDNIKIYIVSHEEEPTFGNTNEFSQAIFAILNNARDIFKIRHTPKAEIHIAIENQKISIRDTGGGIEEKILPVIFSPFVSSHNGSGIGLYMAKNILEKNNATLSASNTQDGAIFTIEFITCIS